MNTFGRQMFPWALLRPKRAGRLARNAFILYLLSRPLRRAINPRRQALRRRYAAHRGASGPGSGWRVF